MEFQFLQQYSNELYQSDTLRSGPMGAMIISIRNKFLVYNDIDISDTERRFLLFALQDTFVTSHSSIVKSQLGISMQFLRPDTRQRTNSQISDPGSFSADGLSGTYTTEWEIMEICLYKLGQVGPEPYKKLERGPDGDPDGVSTPMHHDIRDGTGYNNT